MKLPPYYCCLLISLLAVASQILLSSCQVVAGNRLSPAVCPKKQAVNAVNKVTISSREFRRIVVLSEDAVKHTGIKMGSADTRMLEGSIKTTGEVLANANRVSHVTTPVTGRVVDVKVSVGQRVLAGQTLLTIHSTDIEQAEADLLQNEGQVRADLKRDLLQIDSDLETAAKQLELSASTYQRMKSLFVQRIAAQAEYQTALTQWEKDKIALDTLKKRRSDTISLSSERLKIVTEPAIEKLRLWGLPESEIDAVRRSRRVDPIDTVDAPTAGIVSERLVNPGELVDPTKHLFTIGAYETVWVKADIFEKDVAKVHEGERIELEVDSLPGARFSGKLNYVCDSINADTRALSVRAEVPNPDFKLKPRMFVRLTILTGVIRTIAVPRTAIQDAGDCKVVYVPVDGNRYEERQVVLGRSCGDWVEVLQGLRVGEPVVIKGSFELRSEAMRESS